MDYLDKCVVKTDLYLNKLEANCNLIIFVLNENTYIAFTISDLKKLIENKQKHYIEGVEKLETFIYLPNGIKVDSSLQLCFDNKANTMKLIASKNKFRLGFGANKQFYSYYSVEQVSRQYIGSHEESVFVEDEDKPSVEKKVKEEKEKEKIDSEVEINWEEVKNQNEKRKLLETRIKNKIEAREKRRLEKQKEREKENGNYVETIEYESTIKCKKTFKNFILMIEEWFKFEFNHRDDDKPAVIIYFENGNKRAESWVRYGNYSRTNDLPSEIFYFQNGRIAIENWKHVRTIKNNFPIVIRYHNNGHRSQECWCDNERKLNCRENEPCVIEYHKNGGLKYEERHVNYEKHNHCDKPAVTSYYENGKISNEEWYQNNERHREGDEPARIQYYESGNLEAEEWFQNDKICRNKENQDKPSWISYYESGAVRSEEWFQDGEKYRKNLPEVIQYFENGVIKYSLTINYSKNDFTAVSYHENGVIRCWEFSKKMFENRPYLESFFVEYDEDGIKSLETHETNRNIVKTISFSKKGNKTEEQFYQGESKKVVTFYDSGVIKEEKWFNKNKLCCNIMDLSKPSLISYYENGEIKQEIWFRNGNQIERCDYYRHDVHKSKVTGY